MNSGCWCVEIHSIGEDKPLALGQVLHHLGTLLDVDPMTVGVVMGWFHGTGGKLHKCLYPARVRVCLKNLPLGSLDPGHLFPGPRLCIKEDEFRMTQAHSTSCKEGRVTGAHRALPPLPPAGQPQIGVAR